MKNFKNTSIVTGSLLVGALFSTATGTAANLFDFDYLGTGAELRSNLLSSDVTNILSNKVDDLKCGEGKCGDKKTETKTEAKSKDAKCGEGKCGEKKDAKKTKKAESKSKDAKCGEGKCGN
jgi:uncharacterized low-complexity protein